MLHNLGHLCNKYNFEHKTRYRKTKNDFKPILITFINLIHDAKGEYDYQFT